MAPTVIPATTQLWATAMGSYISSLWPFLTPLYKSTPPLVLSNSIDPAGPEGAQNVVNATKTDDTRSFSEVAATGYSDLHALLIGINDYPHVKKLHGAVADAEAMHRYLRDVLLVPEGQIVTKLDQEATQHVIIRELRKLSSKPIGAPILIYFAGHGTEVCLDQWPEGVQYIVPYDYAGALKQSDAEPTPADSHSRASVDAGNVVHGIADHAFGELLTEIANKQEGHITVILDSCHSGSGTRDSDGLTNRHIDRKTKPPPPPPPAIEDSSGSRAVTEAKGFLNTGLSSHVLMAACQSGSPALEKDRRGRFTKALLDALIPMGHDIDELTYDELMRQITGLDKINQHPQCEGLRRDLAVFSGRPALRKIERPLRKKGKDSWAIDVGSLDGITKGAKFAVYPGRGKYHRVLGTLEAVAITVDVTRLVAMPPATLEPFPDQAIARRVSGGEDEALRLLVDTPDKRLLRIIKRLRNDNLEDLPLKLVSRREDARWIISVENDNIVLEVLDERATKHGYRRLPLKPISVDSVDEVSSLIRSTAHFCWNLRRAPAPDDSKYFDIWVEELKVADDVVIEFIEVERKLEKRRVVAIPKSTNLIQNGEIVLSVDVDGDLDDDSPLYAMTIINKCDEDLYVSIFFFDQSNLSIRPYYLNHFAPKGKTAAPSLRGKDSTLYVGHSNPHGADGAQPYQYSVHAGLDADVGFLKVFVSSVPGDLSYISQDAVNEGKRGGAPAAMDPPAAWDAKVIPVILRRRA